MNLGHTAIHNISIYSVVGGCWCCYCCCDWHSMPPRVVAVSLRCSDVDDDLPQMHNCDAFFAFHKTVFMFLNFVVECCSTGLYQFEFISKAHKLFQCNVVASTVCKYHTRTHTNALGNRQNAKNPKCFVQIIQKCMSLIHSLTNKVP